MKKMFCAYHQMGPFAFASVILYRKMRHRTLVSLEMFNVSASLRFAVYSVSSDQRLHSLHDSRVWAVLRLAGGLPGQP